MKVFHFITSLGIGGAERTLLNVALKTRKLGFQHVVVSLTGSNVVLNELKQHDIPAYNLSASMFDMPLAISKLVHLIRSHRPNVVQTWMYHADLIGSLSARISGTPPVIWNIRHSYLDPKTTKTTTKLVAKCCARLSHILPCKIILCSEASREFHINFGYNQKIMVTIPNGYDLSYYRHQNSAGRELRAELGVSAGTPLIGMISRNHPDKDLPTFFSAARILADKNEQVCFLLVGTGLIPSNKEIAILVEKYNLQKRIFLLGPRIDIPYIASAFNIGTLSSVTEGFPNVIAETMACEIPFVTTNVGDAALLVGDTGIIVPPRDPYQLAMAWQKMIFLTTNSRRALGQAARKQIQEKYSLAKMLDNYCAVWAEFSRVL